MKSNYTFWRKLSNHEELKELAAEIFIQEPEPINSFIVKPLANVSSETKNPSQNYLQLRDKRGKGKR